MSIRNSMIFGTASRGMAACTVAMAAAGWALAGGLTPALATDRGANGEIAFNHGNGQIAVLSGGIETVLPPAGASAPQFSPDGTRIAYYSNFHIWIMKANGTGAKAVPVTGNPYEGDPAWSPDGSKIAYDAWDGSGTGTFQIYTVATATGVVKRLTSGSCPSTEPDWSPDGSQLVFSTVCFDGDGNIAVMPAKGGALTAVALYDEADAGYPSWSPDGSEIVFSANEGQGGEQLWESSPGNPGDGTHVTATQFTSDPGQPDNTAPNWQPVHDPKITAKPRTATPGTAVTATGTDFLSGQTVKLSFIDADGTQTSLGSVKTSLAGGFTDPVIIPAAAAAGKGKLKATGIGGLSATVLVTVVTGA